MMSGCLDLGATHAAGVSVDRIRIAYEFRAPCEMNSCGQYGRN
jgi:hypothetical protein